MELGKQSSQNCKAVFNSRKEAGKDACFRLLRYGALFAPRNKPGDEIVEIQRTQNMQEAYNKRFEKDSRVLRDSSYWRKAAFDEMCSDSIILCREDVDEERNVDRLLKFSEARKAFKKFCRTYVLEESEIFPSFLSIFVSIITEEIESLNFLLQNLKENEHYNGEKDHNVRHSTIHDRSESKILRSFRKEEAIPHESAMRLEALFPKGAAHLHCECYDFLKPKTNLSPDLLHVKISVKKVRSKEERFDRKNRICTYVVRMPSNGKI